MSAEPKELPIWLAVAIMVGFPAVVLGVAYVLVTQTNERHSARLAEERQIMHQRGHDAGKLGIPASANPLFGDDTQDAGKRAAWAEGWIRGWKEKNNKVEPRSGE